MVVAASSGTGNGPQLPDGIDPSQLYDGPIPQGNVSAFPRGPAQQQQAPLGPLLAAQMVATKKAHAANTAIAMVRVALGILNAQLLALIATICSCALWLMAVQDPSTARTIAAAGFSLLVLAPLVWLYWKRSE